MHYIKHAMENSSGFEFATLLLFTFSLLRICFADKAVYLEMVPRGTESVNGSRIDMGCTYPLDLVGDLQCCARHTNNTILSYISDNITPDINTESPNWASQLLTVRRNTGHYAIPYDHVVLTFGFDIAIAPMRIQLDMFICPEWNIGAPLIAVYGSNDQSMTFEHLADHLDYFATARPTRGSCNSLTSVFLNLYEDHVFYYYWHIGISFELSPATEWVHVGEVKFLDVQLRPSPNTQQPNITPRTSTFHPTPTMTHLESTTTLPSSVNSQTSLLPVAASSTVPSLSSDTLAVTTLAVTPASEHIPTSTMEYTTSFTTIFTSSRQLAVTTSTDVIPSSIQPSMTSIPTYQPSSTIESVLDTITLPVTRITTSSSVSPSSTPLNSLKPNNTTFPTVSSESSSLITQATMTTSIVTGESMSPTLSTSERNMITSSPILPLKDSTSFPTQSSIYSTTTISPSQSLTTSLISPSSADVFTTLPHESKISDTPTEISPSLNDVTAKSSLPLEPTVLRDDKTDTSKSVPRIAFLAEEQKRNRSLLPIIGGVIGIAIFIILVLSVTITIGTLYQVHYRQRKVKCNKKKQTTSVELGLFNETFIINPIYKPHMGEDGAVCALEGHPLVFNLYKDVDFANPSVNSSQVQLSVHEEDDSNSSSVQSLNDEPGSSRFTE